MDVRITGGFKAGNWGMNNQNHISCMTDKQKKLGKSADAKSLPAETIKFSIKRYSDLTVFSR